jgi:hypothetical protein
LHVINNHCLPDSDQNLLNEFHSKIDRLGNNHCPKCNERFPSIEIVCGDCCRCHMEKNEVKKFLARNNMNPGDVPEKLQGLIQIEEMLIAQIFPIVSVYYLRDGQYAYRDNVINFPQDVQDFATRLLHHPSSLDVLVVHHNSSDGRVFKDFNVWQSVVSCVFYWLKLNNRYYSNIVIDKEVLRSLPENGSLNDQISRLEDMGCELGSEIDDEEVDNLDDSSILNNFVPIPISIPSEERAVADILTRLQTETASVMWPNIDRVFINEFKTSSYIARAFLTLYPTGAADL